MSQLDQIVASVEDSILPGINYSLNNRKGASFVHQRVLSTFFPTTSGVYSPAAQRSVKIMFSDSGNGFPDLSTIRISLRIRNTGEGPIRLTGGHTACIFQRLQSRSRGQLTAGWWECCRSSTLRCTTTTTMLPRPAPKTVVEAGC